MNIKDVYKYLDAKYPKDFPILKPKIDEFYQQGIKPDRIYNLMSQYIDLKPYCRALDVQNGDIIEFVKAVKIGTFLRAKFNNEETFSIMQKTLVFEDNNICIFKPTNFQESSVIGEPICCFAYSQGRWDEHYNGYQEAIYYVYDVMKEGTQHDFVSITVRPNGRALVLDKEHNWWSKQQSIQYIQSLEEGASYITTKDRKTIKTENKKYKTNTNMAKKQVIRLTESDLHRIIKESVNNVLSENEQEKTYQIISNLEQDLKTVISNTDSSSSQAFGSSDEKLKMITNSLSHISTNLSIQAESTFNKLLEVISELQDIRITLKTLDAKDKYWGHPYKTPNGTVGLSNYQKNK
jgi:protein gp37